MPSPGGGQGSCFFLKPQSFVRPAPRASSVPTTENRSRSRAGAVKAGRAARGHPSGLGLDWPEHGGKIARSGKERAGLSSFKPAVFDHFCAVANSSGAPPPAIGSVARRLRSFLSVDDASSSCNAVPCAIESTPSPRLQHGPSIMWSDCGRRVSGCGRIRKLTPPMQMAAL